MDVFERQVWLYTRGEQSVRVNRDAGGLQFEAAGPGRITHCHTFSDPPALNDFLGWYLAHLEREGWVLHATVDRRGTPREPLQDRPERRRRVSREEAV